MIATIALSCLVCSQTGPTYIRVVPVRANFGCHAQKQPKARIDLYKSSDENSLFVVIGSSNRYFLRLDVAAKKVYRLPLLHESPLGPIYALPIDEDPKPLPDKDSRYEAYGLRVGDCVSFHTPDNGLVTLTGINDGPTFWRLHPLGEPYDPMSDDKVSVVKLKPAYGIAEPIILEITNHSDKPGFAQIEPQEKESDGMFTGCLDDESLGLFHDPIDLPAHKTVRRAFDLSKYRRYHHHFKRGHIYRFELMGSGALEGGGGVVDTSTFLLK